MRRATAPARDGVPLPVSILMPKGAPLDGSRPLLLYAYGSYGATTEPTFSSSVFSLVDRGMVYAIAHVRGGQEMGRQWYDDAWCSPSGRSRARQISATIRAAVAIVGFMMQRRSGGSTKRRNPKRS